MCHEKKKKLILLTDSINMLDTQGLIQTDPEAIRPWCTKHQQTVEPPNTWTGIHGNQTTTSWILAKTEQPVIYLWVISLQRQVSLAWSHFVKKNVSIKG